MKTMMRVLAIGLVGMASLLAVPAKAEVYQNGFVTTSGYVYRDGLWTLGGKFFTRDVNWRTRRTLVNGCYATEQYPVWEYTEVATPYIAPAVAVPVYGTDWKADGVKAVQAQQDVAAYLAFVDKLQGAAPTPYAPTLGGLRGSYNAGSFGLNSTSLWGYNRGYDGGGISVSDASILFQRDNLGVAIQGLNRGLDNVARLHGDALAGSKDLAAQLSEADAQTARILAAAEVLRASQGPPVRQDVHIGQQQQGGVGPVAPPYQPGPPGPPLMPQASAGAAWQASAQLRCAGCHGAGKEVKGGFNVMDYPGLPPEQKAKVLARITSGDPEKRMPRKPDGSPDAPLPPGELAEWLRQ